MNPPDDAAPDVAADSRIRIPCDAPAPLVVNGALFVGCQLDKDHEPPHKVEITWGEAP